jgi:hypothetical protein
MVQTQTRAMKSITVSETSPQESKLKKEKLNHDDDDEQSQDSSYSLYSHDDLDRLEADFALRDELFDKVIAEKDSNYVQVVKDYEQSMRNMLREHTKQRLCDNHEAPIDETPFAKLSLLQKIKLIVTFDEARSGYATLLLYCIAHLSCWEIGTTALYELTKNVTNETVVHILLLLTSLVLYRMTGGIFLWVDSETHHRAKLAIQHRLELQSPDALVIDWFQRHKFFRRCSNLCSFYMCLFAVFYFHGHCLRFIDKRSTLVQSLPSANCDVLTSAKEKLLGLDDEWEDVCLPNDVCDAEQLESNDYAYLASELSISSYAQFLGDDSVALVSTWGAALFYLTTASISILVLHFKLGHTFGRD